MLHIIFKVKKKIIDTKTKIKSNEREMIIIWWTFNDISELEVYTANRGAFVYTLIEYFLHTITTKFNLRHFYFLFNAVKHKTRYTPCVWTPYPRWIYQNNSRLIDYVRAININKKSTKNRFDHRRSICCCCCATWLLSWISIYRVVSLPTRIRNL